MNRRDLEFLEPCEEPAKRASSVELVEPPKDPGVLGDRSQVLFRREIAPVHKCTKASIQMGDLDLFSGFHREVVLEKEIEPRSLHSPRDNVLTPISGVLLYGLPVSCVKDLRPESVALR